MLLLFLILTASKKQLTDKSASKTTEENVLRTHIALNLDTRNWYLETLAYSTNTKSLTLF